jgi:hypothetical protein
VCYSGVVTHYEMAEPEDEQIFVTKKNYSPTQQVHVNDFAAKLRLARTVIVLGSIKQDIQRSDLISNMAAIMELKSVANLCAKELGFKGGVWWE